MISAEPHYLRVGLLIISIPVLVATSRCSDLSSSLNSDTPLVAKCRELPSQVQCATAVLSKFTFLDAKDYCQCLGRDVHLLNRLDSSFKGYISALHPDEHFWLNVELKILEKFTDVRKKVYPKQNDIVQNNPQIDHCAAVWPGREAVTGDLVRQAHSCLHETKFYVCRKDGGSCSYITNENRPLCITWNQVSQVTWFEARRRCIQDGGDLVYLLGNETFKSVLGEKRSAAQVWVGMRRNVWQWMNGTEVLTADWSISQLPAKDNATCATLTTSSGKWKSQRCNSSFKFLCVEFKSRSGNKDADRNDYTINYYIIGGILGGILVLLIFVLCCVWMCKCRNSEENPMKRWYMTMPAGEDFAFHSPDSLPTPGHVNPGHVNPAHNNLLRTVPNANALQISSGIQRDRFGNIRPHSGGHNKRPQLARSLSSGAAQQQHRFIANTIRSVSLEDMSIIGRSREDTHMFSPPLIPAGISGSQGHIPQSSPLFTRRGSNNIKNSKNKNSKNKNRNHSPNGKDRSRNSKYKIQRMNSKNAKNTGRNPPLNPVMPSHRGEVILGLHDGRVIDQNRPQNKKSKNNRQNNQSDRQNSQSEQNNKRSKKAKKNNPTYVNDVSDVMVPPLPPRINRNSRDSQCPLAENEGNEDHPADYSSHDRFRY